MLKTDLRIAAKNIFKSKGLNLVNILGLALGISACLAIWVILRFEGSYDNFHPGKNRIYRLISWWHLNTGESFANGSVPMPTANEARKELPGIETLAAFYNYNATVTIPHPSGENKQFPKTPRGQHNDELVFAQPEYFQLFHYQWLAGNPTTALTQPFQVVLSTKQALKYFGSSDWESLIGKQVIYDDSLRTTVKGIVKELVGNTDFTFTDFISFSTITTSYLRNTMEPTNWGRFVSPFQVFVRLQNGVSPKKFGTQLQAFALHHFQLEGGRTYEARLQPLSDLHYNDQPDKDYGRHASLPVLYGLLGIAAIILIIAAVNFINLSLAQSLRRVKEVGIRKVLGSSRKGLVLQFLTETFLMTLLALTISILIVRPVLASFPSFIPKGVALDILDPANISFTLILLGTTTLIAGLYPGWVLSSFQPANALKSNTGLKGGLRDNFRKGLIVFQFTISLVFIIVSIVIGDQLHFMLNKDMGFKQDAIITLNTNGRESAKTKQLFADRVRNLPGVDRVSADDLPPAIQGARQMSWQYPGTPPREIGANIRIADENYIPLYQIKILAGRNFFPGDTLHAVMINQSCARMLGFQHPGDAIGHILQTFNGRCPIVGVLADFNIQPLTRNIGPLIIQSDPADENAYSIKLKTKGKQVGDFTTTLASIERVWQQTFPNEAFVYHFYDDTIADFYRKERQTSQLIYLGMAIAVFLSCIGLFALAALTAETRKKEIGIRKVMGAAEAGLVYLIVKDFLKLVFLSFVVASPVAWVLTKNWLQNYTYRIPVSWWIFALACGAAMLIALLTVGYHVIRTATANPVKVLRIE